MRFDFWRKWRKFGVNPLLRALKIKDSCGFWAVISTCIPYIARFGSIAAYVYTWPVRTQEKGQVLAYRGVLSAVGMVYSV